MSLGGRSAHFDVAVIGAGLSGLVTAHALRRSGHRVALLEASHRAGGVIGTRHRDGFRYETGANSALDNTPLVSRLIDELGIGGERVDVSPRASKRFVVRDSRLLALPMSPRALLTSRAFGTMAKLRLLREPFIPAAPGEREETVAEFARRRLGDEWLDYAVDPFVSGIHAGDPGELSIRAAFPRVHALEQRHGSVLRGQIRVARERRRTGERAVGPPRSFSFREGMQTLTDALAGGFGDVSTNTRAELRRNPGGSGFEVRSIGNGSTLALTADSVVVSTPADAASQLVHALAPQAARALAAIEYAPVAIVASAYRRDDVTHPLDGFGFLVPSREKLRILGTLFSSSMFADRAPQGQVLLTTFAGGRRDAETAAQDDTTLARIVDETLAALLGAHRPLWTDIVRWPKAIPQYTLGHDERIAAVDRAIAEVPGLFFCANWRGGIAVGDCVRSGYAVAESVERFLLRTSRA